MKKRGFLNLCIVAAALSVTAGTLYSCKDYDDEMYAELNEHDSTLGDKIAAQEAELEQTKADLEKALADLQKNMQDNYATKAEVAAKAEVLQNAIDALDAALNKKVDSVAERVVALEVAREEVAAKLETIGQRLDALEEKASALGTTEEIKQMVKEVADTKAKAEANEALAKANAEKITGLDSKVKANEAAIKALNEKQAELEKALNDEIAKVNATINTRVSELQKAMNEVEGKLQKQINDLKADFTTLQAEVNGLKKDLESLGVKFDTILNNMITSVVSNGAYSPVVGYFSLPTGLKSNILAAYYGKTDADVYFPTTSTVNYINPAQAFTAAEQELLGFNEDKPQFVGGQTVLDPSEANAGKVYVTVNPSSVNMEGKTFALVNTIGEKAGMTLGAAKKSTDKLAFGYSRAGVNNGFYEIPAKLTADQIETAKLRLEFDDLKEAIKDAATPDDGVDVTNVVSTLFTCINDIADANAIEATWKDTLGEHSVYSDYAYAAVAVKPLSYNSLIDMNRTQFWGVDKAYALVDKIIGKLRGFANDVKPNFDFNLTAPQIGKIKLIELTKEDLAKFVVEINPMVAIDFYTAAATPSSLTESYMYEPNTYNPAKHTGTKVSVLEDYAVKNLDGTLEIKKAFDVINANVNGVSLGEKVVTILPQTIKAGDFKDLTNGYGFVAGTEVKCSMTTVVDMSDAIKDMMGNVNGSLEDANAQMDALQKYVDDVNKLLGELKSYEDKVNNKVDGAINELESKLNNFITKVNGKLCQIVNSINAALQPVVFAKGMDDFVMISGAQTAPSVFPSSFVLVPSSYTAEYLAPAAKKFVAVTNVFKGGASAQAKDADCVKVLKAANENAQLNVVLPGNTYDVKVEGLKSGYTYEFTYSALDFYGKIANTKCYITVK